MPGGQPPKYTNVEEVQQLIVDWLNDCEQNNTPLTVTWLALCLGFTSRQSLLNYETKPEFMDTIKRAKLEIEHYNEKKLYDKSTPTSGVIFNLTNNYGWQNKLYNDNTNRNKEITPEEQAAIDRVLDNDE